MSKRTNYYIIPTNFKTGQYILARYKTVDLVLLCSGCFIGVIFCLTSISIATYLRSLFVAVIGIVLGVIIVISAIVLTANTLFYHNFLGRFLCFLRFRRKNKKYVYKGVNYKAYEEDE